MRQKDDLPFVQVLEKIKRGQVNEAHVRIFLDKMLLPLRGQEKGKNPLILKLYTTNQNVKNENEREYEKLEGEEYTYFAEDGGEYTRHFYEKNTNLGNHNVQGFEWRGKPSEFGYDQIQILPQFVCGWLIWYQR